VGDSFILEVERSLAAKERYYHRGKREGSGWGVLSLNKGSFAWVKRGDLSLKHGEMKKMHRGGKAIETGMPRFLPGGGGRRISLSTFDGTHL